MNGSTWVQCTISDGHISQVLFLSQRSVYSDDQILWMTFSDEGIHGSEVQGVRIEWRGGSVRLSGFPGVG